MQNLPCIMYFISFCQFLFQRSCHAWRITVQHQANKIINIAEFQFFRYNHIVNSSNFLFTASSFLDSVNISGGVSGPPAAANDGYRNTFFHSKVNDPNPTLTINTVDNTNATIFDRMKIINRQDFYDWNDNFFGRLIGAKIIVYDYNDNVVFSSQINSSLSSTCINQSTRKILLLVALSIIL